MTQSVNVDTALRTAPATSRLGEATWTNSQSWIHAIAGCGGRPLPPGQGEISALIPAVPHPSLINTEASLTSADLYFPQT